MTGVFLVDDWGAGTLYLAVVEVVLEEVLNECCLALLMTLSASADVVN